MGGIGSAWRNGRLNWLQQNWLRGDPQDPATAHENNLYRFVPTQECRVDRLIEVLAALIVRHESLRTVVDYDEVSGAGVQWVSAPPATAADIEHVVEVVDRDLCDQAARERMVSEFDIRSEWPVRFIVAERAGRAHGVHVLIDHSATDSWGLRILRRDLLAGLDDGWALGPESVSTSSVSQPLDVTAWEESPIGVKRSEITLGYWRDRLKEFRHFTNADQVGGQDSMVGTSRRYRLESRRLGAAAAKAAARFSVSTETIFLCAFGWALGTVNETQAAGALGINLNRFRESDIGSVSLRFTCAPIVIPGPSAGAIEKVVKRVYSERMRSSSVGHAPPERIDAVIRDILPDALSPNVCGAYFNYITLSRQYDSNTGHDADQVLLDDEIVARKSSLMLVVEYSELIVIVSLIGDIGSRFYTQGREFLESLARSIYWMASAGSYSPEVRA